MRVIKAFFKFILSTILSLLLATVLLVGYVFYIEPNRLVVKHYEVDLTQGQQLEQKLKIVQFSDVHLGEFYSLEQLEKVVEKVNKQQPDLIIFTGDLMDIPAQFKERSELSKVLGKIESRYGKFAVWGNHDYGGGGVRFYEQMMNEAGFNVLCNERYKVKLSSGEIFSIVGVDEAMFGNPNGNGALKKVKEEDHTLLILHEPDLIQDIDMNKVDLALAGHSHGGQIKLPGIGALVTPPLAEIYTDGLYQLKEGGYLYVNSGIGTTKIPVRFFVPPQIAVFEVLV